jgi:prepilin-type N-terminal cleavage/methylation domain-containing protein
MKKAFTLSEALVTLAIIGVLAAILIPVVDQVKPDKDKITYKKALYSMQTAVADAMDTAVYSIAANGSDYWKDTNISDEAFCEAIADSLNTSGAVNCTETSSYANPNFITSDGVRFWGLENKFTGDERTIYVDRALGSSELNAMARKRGRGDKGMKIQVRYDGKVMTPDNEEFSYENDLIENSLQVAETRNK